MPKTYRDEKSREDNKQDDDFSFSLKVLKFDSLLEEVVTNNYWESEESEESEE